MPESTLLAQTYHQIKRDFGALVEPFTLHAPTPRLLAGIWMATRENGAGRDCTPGDQRSGRCDRIQVEPVPVLRRCSHHDAACGLGSRCCRSHQPGK